MANPTALKTRNGTNNTHTHTHTHTHKHTNTNTLTDNPGEQTPRDSAAGVQKHDVAGSMKERTEGMVATV